MSNCAERKEPYIDYGMYTDEGNEAIEDSFLLLERDLENATRQYKEHLFKIVRKHPEFTDTDVRGCVGTDLVELVMCLSDSLAEAAGLDPDGILALIVRRIWGDTDTDIDAPLTPPENEPSCCAEPGHSCCTGHR